jgi:hypothetical protein
MRRMIVLLTMAATMGAMVLLTASVAFANHEGGGGGVGLEAFCEAQVPKGTMSIESGGPTCTYTVTAEAPAQHGFTLTTSQVFRINVGEFNAHAAPTPVGEPIPVSCQNPGGIDVPVDNPNCTAAS